MAIATLTDVAAAIVAGLDGITGMSAASVSADDVLVINKADSILVDVGNAGEEDIIAGGDIGLVFGMTFRPDVELWIKDTGNIKRLYDDTRTYIGRVLAWFRANPQLGLAASGVHSVHPIVWQAKDERTEINGVSYRVITFTPTIVIRGMTA